MSGFIEILLYHEIRQKEQDKQSFKNTNIDLVWSG